MSKSRQPPQIDTQGIRSRFVNPPATAFFAHTSESDESSDSLESPTMHCYVAGTRPKRTAPHRTMSTGVVEMDPVSLKPGMDLTSLNFANGIPERTTNMTPPRSQSAVDLRRIGSSGDPGDAFVHIPHLGNRSIYTPPPPSLTRLYDNNRMNLGKEMDFDTKHSFKSVVTSLDGLKVGSPSSPWKGSLSRRRNVSYYPYHHPSPCGLRRGSKYASDEEMHIITTTDEEESETEFWADHQFISAPLSVWDDLKQQVQQNDACGRVPSWFMKITPTSSPNTAGSSTHLLQTSSQNISSPLFIVSKCECGTLKGSRLSTNAKGKRKSLVLPFAHY